MTHEAERWQTQVEVQGFQLKGRSRCSSFGEKHGLLDVRRSRYEISLTKRKRKAGRGQKSSV